MMGLAILWGVVLVGAAVVYALLPDNEEESRLVKWRSVAAGALIVGVVGTALLGRIDPDLHTCEKTTVTKVTDDNPTVRNVEGTQACTAPLDLGHVALLMVPVLALVAPALSEFTIAGLFGAKIREVASKEAERKTILLFGRAEVGETFLDALRASQTGEDLGDLPND